ncbi:MAG TPA: hypothetical protein VMX17_00625 [Candidatus Glassbacteria bacterium]|nr:hypothetical protein [Candidatus Glassbacteria bacterium]
MGLRLLLWSCPGAPIFELGDQLSTFHDIDFFTVEIDNEEEYDYFEDHIKSIDFDTGDLNSGSEKQQLSRDPASSAKERDISEADPSIELPEGILDPSEIDFFADINQGIIATEIPELSLIEWSNKIIFLNAKEGRLIDWFDKRLECQTCGASYHLEDKKPERTGKCDRCGSELFKTDDKEEIKAQFKDWRNIFWKFEQSAKDSGKQIMYNVDDFDSFKRLLKRVDLDVRGCLKKGLWY